MSHSLKATIATTVGSSFIIESACAAAQQLSPAPASLSTAFQFAQLPLPYATNALEPWIDTQTMEIHYTKHHTAYIKNVNEAIVAEKLPYTSEQEFFTNAATLSAKVRNNAGGAWNHNFFWQMMKPKASDTPYGKLVAALDASFGSVPKFKEQFTAAALSRFGSGWAWLVKDREGKLRITSTPNQDNPLMNLPAVQAGDVIQGTPLLGLDVWEHAYYLKYQNKRNEYIEAFWNVLNWDEVSKRLG